MTSRRNPLFGPRVSISSFGPKIEHPKCGYCTEDASIPCTNCNATWYCTVTCQEVDRPVHDMICQIYTDFVTAHPCPQDTFDKKYRLGLLLPVDSEKFELAWIANGSSGKSVATFLQYYDQDRINTRKTLVDCNMASKGFDHSIILAVRGNFRTDNSLPNACINHMMDGKLKYALKGPVAVVSESGQDSFGTAQHFQPCDFRILIDFLFNYEGNPDLEVGHACGSESKGILGASVTRFLKFFKGKAPDGKSKSTNTLFDVEDHRIYRHRAASFTESDWVMDSASFLPKHRVQRSQSSVKLGSCRDDGSSLHRPKPFVLPDFIPDWITGSKSIAVGPQTHSNTVLEDRSSNNKKKTVKPAASIDSLKITTISEGITRVYRNDNVSIRDSVDIFNIHSRSVSKIIHHDSASVLSARPSPPVITTTSFFHPKSMASKSKGSTWSTTNTTATLFSRPRSNGTNVHRDGRLMLQLNVRGSVLMSPWMV
ncbi:hypothetical protein SBOR_5723 [Sclerotinia borealis F-4128]|uniref:MYND-type domain-containing protein n=1 Tax=Sclerotinia borealis (strain F-4128) TaxID=1432307 RepID=W9CAY3_SCLBF|nr:hypothetical protein SBOR_5723 [Sclerotinia borealis F-4128]